MYALCLKTAFTEACGFGTVRRSRDPLRGAVSLDMSVGEDDGGTALGELIADPRAEDEVYSFVERDRLASLKAALERALSQIPPAQAEAIRAEFFRGERVDPKTRAAAIRSLRHPKISSGLKEYK